jgi:hypothetical protein
MQTKTKPSCTRGRRYNAFAVRRRIRHLEVLAGNVHRFTCYSMTRQGHEVQHHQEVDLETGHVQCSCEHFGFSKAMRGANLVTWIEGDAAALCKHLQRASEWLWRHGHLERFRNVRLRPCHSCGVADAEHELADENGHAINGFICGDCVTRARMMDATPEPEPEPYAGYDEWLDGTEELQDDDFCADCGGILEEMPRAIAPYDYEMVWACPHCTERKEAEAVMA